MANQEQIIDQTEGQVANGTNVTDAPAEALADAQVTEAAAEAVAVDPATEASAEVVAVDPATDAQEQPLNAFYNGGAIEFKAPEPYPMARENEDNAFFIDGELHLVLDGKVVSGPYANQDETDEQAPAQKKGKGRRNQKKRQAPPQVWQWLNANFERKTERGIIVRKGKARFHVDFRDMALAEDGTAIRFQDGDKVRVRVMSMDRTDGLPQASMLGKMLPPVKRPANGIQAEVVRILVGHAVLDSMRPELPSQEAMEEHERFAKTMAEAVAQAAVPSTEAPAQAVVSEPSAELVAPSEAGGLMFGELYQPTSAQAQEPGAPAETDPVD